MIGVEVSNINLDFVCDKIPRPFSRKADSFGLFRASSNRNGQKNRKIGIRAPKK